MPVPSKKTVIILAGPTAVGKTCVALDLAKHFKTEIISADSRQCFRELRIGVARPPVEILKEVPHHFIASHSIIENIHAGFFEEFALKKVNELFQRHDVVIMTGGTGLYIKAFCEGLDDIPQIDREIRKKINRHYELDGIAWLQKEIKEKDPVFYSSGEIQNPQRLMRALEVFEGTGMSITSFRRNKIASRDFDIVKIGLELPKEELHRNIDERVDIMLNEGLVDEVASLISFRHLNALQTVGYSEIFEYFDQKISLPDAVGKIKINTRQYAKRQVTWFRKEKDFHWYHPLTIKMIIKDLTSFNL